MATNGKTTRERVEIAAAALTKMCDEVEAGRASHTSLNPLQLELRKANAEHAVAVAGNPISKGFPSAASLHEPSAGVGLGLIGKALADSGFNLKSKPSASVSAFTAFGSKAVVLPSAGDWSPRTGGIVGLGRDSRFLWPSLNREDAGSDTSVSDFRQTTRTVTGTVQRALDAVTEKATLNTAIVLANEPMAQHAVIIPSIPNALFDSVPQLSAFLGGEGQFVVEQSIDEHVMSQIVAAAPLFGITGSSVIEQVRNGIAAMRATGANPTIVVLNPTDAAALDLSVDAGGFVFPTTSTGTASPLWGLRVVEHAGVGNEPPYLIDPQALGVLYLGQLSFASNMYSEFSKNLTSLRIETSALFHVRSANGARRIAAA